MENFANNNQLLSTLLGLEDIEIIEVKLRSDHTLLIRVKSTKEETTCRQCGGPTKPHGQGRTLELRHLPIFGKECIIEITPPRGICEQCDDHPTTTQTLSWYERNGHHTKAYEKHILLSLVHSTIADVSIKENISEQAIQRVVDKSITEKIQWKEIKTIGILGIDEVSLKKGYRDFLSLVTSRVDGIITILGVIKGRGKADIKAFFSSIPKKKRKTISAVCCDMYDGYINAAKEVFGESIPVVVDRFHVAQLYRKCLVSIRKKELARLRKELSTEAYQLLKPAIAILVQQKECYSREDKLKLEPLFKYSPALKAAYRLARQLTTIFNTHHRKVKAMNKINAWIEKVKSSGVSCFDVFIETLNKYQEEITNYFIKRHTSGFVEGFNNKVKVMKRRCYGIFNLKHFFQRLFLDLSGYRIYLKNQCIVANC
jgi:transposase